MTQPTTSTAPEHQTRQNCWAAARLDRGCRPDNSGRASDRGAATVAVVLALAASALLLVPILLTASLLGTDPGGAGGCSSPGGLGQPGTTKQATTDIPTPYLNLYQQAGTQYELPWNLLAAIGKVESDHGRHPGPGVRSGANWAGAAGPMQIGIGGKATNTWGGTPRHPTTQHTGGYATDGNGDGWADVYDPADAIPAAARYLLAHDAPTNLDKALYAYNPSTTYVHTVHAQARRYADTAVDIDPSGSAGSGDTSMSEWAGCPGDVAAYTSLPGNTTTKIITYARNQLGKPYLWGGTGPDAFDCSGLTMMAYRAAGLTIPRLTYDQWQHGTRITAGHEQPGDLVFFRMGPRGPEHVALVYQPQHGLMIAAPRRGDVVKVQSYKAYPGGPLGFIRPDV